MFRVALLLQVFATTSKAEVISEVFHKRITILSGSFMLFNCWNRK